MCIFACLSLFPRTAAPLTLANRYRDFSGAFLKDPERVKTLNIRPGKKADTQRKMSRLPIARVSALSGLAIERAAAGQHDRKRNSRLYFRR